MCGASGVFTEEAAKLELELLSKVLGHYIAEDKIV